MNEEFLEWDRKDLGAHQVCHKPSNFTSFIRAMVQILGPNLNSGSLSEPLVLVLLCQQKLMIICSSAMAFPLKLLKDPSAFPVCRQKTFNFIFFLFLIILLFFNVFLLQSFLQSQPMISLQVPRERAGQDPQVPQVLLDLEVHLDVQVTPESVGLQDLLVTATPLSVSAFLTTVRDTSVRTTPGLKEERFSLTKSVGPGGDRAG